MKIKLNRYNGGWAIIEWDDIDVIAYDPDDNMLNIYFRNTDKNYTVRLAPTGNEDFFNLIKNMNFKWDKSAEVEMFPRMYSPEYYQHGFNETGAKPESLI
jgi:hypothetical protein